MSTHFRVARAIPRYVAPAGNAYSTAVLADSPVLYWRLGESSGTTIVDSSGNSRNGTYANSPTLGVAGATTDGDKAVTFNGTTQQGALAYASWMSTAASSNFTIEAWVKGTGVGQVIFGRGSSSTVGYLGISASGKLFIQSRGTGFASNQNATGATTINDGNWHHVVGVRNGTALHVYVDGVLDDSTTAGDPGSVVTDTTNGMYVASRNGSAFLAGSVDECAWYASDIGATRIAAHYAAR